MSGMMVITHSELIGQIDAFLARHPAIGESRFGREATGEPALVSTLRGGRSPTLRVLHKIAEYMRTKDAEVPA